MKQSMVQIIRLDFKTMVNGRSNPVLASDYVIVPRLTTFGTFAVDEMLPVATLAQLSHLRDQLAGVTRRGKGTNERKAQYPSRGRGNKNR